MKLYIEFTNIIFSPYVYVEINCTDYIPNRTKIRKHWYSKQTISEYWSGYIKIGLNQQIWVRIRDKKFRLEFSHLEFRSPIVDIIAVFKIQTESNRPYKRLVYARLGEFSKQELDESRMLSADFESKYQLIDPSDY